MFWGDRLTFSDKDSLAHNLLIFVPFIFNQFIRETAMKGVDALSDMRRALLLMLLKNRPNVSMTVFSNIMSVSKSNVTLLVDRLVRDGYIYREASDRDRRVQVLRLTSIGEEQISRVQRIWEERIGWKLSSYTAEEQASMNEHLVAVMDIFYSRSNLINREESGNEEN